MAHEWGYSATNGPDKWAELFPIANGSRQSPINIITSQVQYDSTLKPLKLQYDPSMSIDMLNNGHTVHVSYKDDNNNSTLTGGPVTGTYRLKQFHFHWGSADSKGCEHTIDGIKYPCELHLVHWNTKYASFDEAKDKADGLAVVGIFLKIGAANTSLQKIVDSFVSVKAKDKKITFTNFDPKTLLPATLNYWTYEGSLTAPPLYESVTWIILRDQISVSSAQMAQFRGLLFGADGAQPCYMCDNFRPPQPIKTRKVRANFK